MQAEHTVRYSKKHLPSFRVTSNRISDKTVEGQK